MDAQVLIYKYLPSNTCFMPHPHLFAEYFPVLVHNVLEAIGRVS
jgi:hypothetical protein